LAAFSSNALLRFLAGVPLLGVVPLGLVFQRQLHYVQRGSVGLLRLAIQFETRSTSFLRAFAYHFASSGLLCQLSISGHRVAMRLLSAAKMR